MFGFTYSPRQFNAVQDVVRVHPPARCGVGEDADLAPHEILFRAVQSWPLLGARLIQAIHFQLEVRGTPLTAESFDAEVSPGSPLASTLTAGLLDAHGGVTVADSTGTPWAIRSPCPEQRASMAVSYGRHLAALDPLYRLAFRRQFNSWRAAGHCADTATGGAAKAGRQFFLQQTDEALQLLLHLAQESRQQDRHDVVLCTTLLSDRLQLPASESGSSLGELLRLLSTLRFAEVRFAARDWRPELLGDSPAIKSVQWIDRNAVVVSLGPKVEEAIRVFSQSMPGRAVLATASDA